MVEKEFGSDFHLCLDPEWLNNSKTFFSKHTSFFLSGRAALYSLLKQGVKKHNWKSVYFPSYYCQEVIDYVTDLSIDIHTYEYNPFLDKEDTIIDVVDDSKNVIINVDFFGIKKNCFKALKEVILVDDLTHNLLGLKTSKADYSFGSLRKELPMPLGGFLYSKKNKVKKGVESNFALNISMQRLTAMMLKRNYLNQVSEDKNTYRKIFVETEQELQFKQGDLELPKVLRSLLKELNISKILTQKKINLSIAIANLKLPQGAVLNLDKKKGFGLLFYFESENERDLLRSYLIDNRIYPAILWPNQILDRDKDVEKRNLFVHLDYRYNKSDVDFIVNKLNIFFNG